MPSSVHTPDTLPSASPLTGKLRTSAATDFLERTMLEKMRRPATSYCNHGESVKDLSLLGAQHAQRISRTPGSPLHNGRNKDRLLQKLRQVEALALNGGAQDGGAGQPLTSSLLKHHSSAFPPRAASCSGQALPMGSRSRAGSLSASWSQPIKTGDIGSEAAAHQRLTRPRDTAQLIDLRASDPMPLPSSPMLQRQLAEPASLARPTTAAATAAPSTGHGGFSDTGRGFGSTGKDAGYGSTGQDLQFGSTPALPPLHLSGGPSMLASSSTPAAHCIPGPLAPSAQNGSEQQGWCEQGGEEGSTHRGAGYTLHHQLSQQQYQQQQQQRQQQQLHRGTFTAPHSTRNSLPHTAKPLAWQPPWHPPIQPLEAWQSLSSQSSPRQHSNTHASSQSKFQTPGMNTMTFGDQRAQIPRVNQARNRLEKFTPTRGMILSVFEELDRFGEDKLTASTLEEAAVRVGLNAQQIKRFYNMLDPHNRGFITMRDWGNATLNNQVMGFTRLYVQATRGIHGKMMDEREVKTAALAMQIALSRLQMKTVGRSVAHSKLHRIFEFMDTDRSGGLSLQEIHDAFSALGIHVNNQALQEIMQKFDKNQDGTIDYREFIKGLFPIMSQGCRGD